jgi:hypothetical protein
VLTCDRISKPSCLTTDDILLQFRLIAARSRIAAGKGMSLRDLPTNCCNRAAFEGICELAAMSKPYNVSGFQRNLGSSESGIKNSRCSIGAVCSGRCRLACQVQYHDVCLFAKANSNRQEVASKSHDALAYSLTYPHLSIVALSPVVSLYERRAAAIQKQRVVIVELWAR